MATTLYRRGRIHTPGDEPATALLVDDDTIAWVGQESEAPSADATVDLEGAWVAPAFVDAHVHATSTGLALTGLDLTGARSLAEALQALERHSRSVRGGVVLGTGWDETRWPERRPPTAAELDRASYGGVVYLARTDVHSAVASSALLAACPAARGLPGYLTDGLVRQDAHHAVRRTAQESISPQQRRTAQLTMLDRAASLGIACVHECGGPDIYGEDDFEAVLALEHGVERIGYWGELNATDKARELGAAGAGGDLFVDGSLGSHTACLTADYLDADGRGHGYLDAEQIAAHVVACTRAELQAGFHAIGDAALQAVADGYQQAADLLGAERIRAARHRVEHVEMVSTAQIATFAALGVVASVQPTFDARWGGPQRMYAERLGPERAAAMNPFAAMASAGVALALGSDSPVTALDPWGTIRAAVHHETPASALSPEAAFAAHTTGGWHAAKRDGEGSLVPGAAATIVVWEVAGLPDLSGPDPQCRRALVRGRITYQK